MRDFTEIYEKLKSLAIKTIEDCSFIKKAYYFDTETEESLLLPSGDEKYLSFWVRDCAMMSESLLLADSDLKKYIRIIAAKGQNGGETLHLENGLTVPPYAIADHINYDGRAVYFPGTYESGKNQGDGSFGFYPPLCDNYYYIIMVGAYVEQTGDLKILDEEAGGLSIRDRLRYAFEGYNIDSGTDLCISEADKYTVDWGFTDSIKKTGKLLMPSILRYRAALVMENLTDDSTADNWYYIQKAEKIKNSIISEFYDNNTGWFRSATEIGRQYDVWATAYLVFLDVTHEDKTLRALYDAYTDKTAVVDGYVRHILTTDDFSSDTAWEYASIEHNTYQNGAYWSTPAGWYSYALFLYSGKADILVDFLNHVYRYEKSGAPFEWINDRTTDFSGLRYGTSGVLPYMGMKKIIEALQDR